MRWRVRFQPTAKATFAAGAWETVVEHESYQQAVVLAGRQLVLAMRGSAANRLYWMVTLVEMLDARVPSGVVEFDGPGTQRGLASRS